MSQPSVQDSPSLTWELNENANQPFPFLNCNSSSETKCIKFLVPLCEGITIQTIWKATSSDSLLTDDLRGKELLQNNGLENTGCSWLRTKHLLLLHWLWSKFWLPAKAWLLVASDWVSHGKWAHSNQNAEESSPGKLLRSSESLVLWPSSLNKAQVGVWQMNCVVKHS